MKEEALAVIAVVALALIFLISGCVQEGIQHKNYQKPAGQLVSTEKLK